MKSTFLGALCICCALLLLSCAAEENDDTQNLSTEPVVIEVTAKHDPKNNRHFFETDIDTVPAGWTTFREGLINSC